MTSFTLFMAFALLSSLSRLQFSLSSLIAHLQAVALMLCSVASQAQTSPATVAQVPVSRPVLATETSTRAEPLRIVLLLPLDNSSLQRAATTVRDGMQAVFSKNAPEVELSNCSYDEGASLIAAYVSCVNERTDWVIGPLGRSDVSALVQAKLPILRPTLMLSPLALTPPSPMAVLAPELETEAEALAQQMADNGCRKPLVIEAAGGFAARISVAVSSFWQRNLPTRVPLQHFSLAAAPRSSWRHIAQTWRDDGIDCVLFAGNNTTLTELRPFLRDSTLYITSASYETPLDRVVDWTGVLIADMPWLLDPSNPEFAAYAPSSGAPNSLTLSRLYALGIDAARLALAAKRGALPSDFAGAIGHLTLRNAQYRRRPMIGEFRGQTPTQRNR